MVAANTSQITIELASAGNVCPINYTKITSAMTCRAVAKEVNLMEFAGVEYEQAWPGGCYYCNNVPNCLDGVWFNSHPEGSSNGGAAPICVPLGWEEGRDLSMSTLFIGDSDIELWDTDSIFPNSINLGIGGDTCIDVLDGIDKTLLFEQFQPEWVVVVCGENDLAYGRSAANTFDKFVAVVDKINISGARAIPRYETRT